MWWLNINQHATDYYEGVRVDKGGGFVLFHHAHTVHCVVTRNDAPLVSTGILVAVWEGASFLECSLEVARVQLFQRPPIRNLKGEGEKKRTGVSDKCLVVW
jgi:hypothetical protein